MSEVCVYCGSPIANCHIGEYCSNEKCGYVDGYLLWPEKNKKNGLPTEPQPEFMAKNKQQKVTTPKQVRITLPEKAYINFDEKYVGAEWDEYKNNMRQLLVDGLFTGKLDNAIHNIVSVSMARGKLLYHKELTNVAELQKAAKQT